MQNLMQKPWTRQWLPGIVAVAMYVGIRLLINPILIQVFAPWLSNITPETLSSIPLVPRFLEKAIFHTILGLIGVIGIRWLSRLGRTVPVQRETLQDAFYLAIPGMIVAAILNVTAQSLGVIGHTLLHQPPLPVWPRIPGWLPYSFVLMMITAPIGEELLVRGYLFPSVLHSFGRIPAYLITTALWWWIHGDGSWGVIGASIGLLLLWEVTGRLEATVLAHSLMNGLVLLKPHRIYLSMVVIATMVVGATVVWIRWKARIVERVNDPYIEKPSQG